MDAGGYLIENFSLRIAVNLEGLHLKIFEKLNYR
jgi:hypothetical protein